MWPDAYHALLDVETAIHLAIKDKRLDEVPVLAGQRDILLRMFVAFLEHSTVGELREYGQIESFSTGTLVPLASLLAGPTSVEV
jgi:uridine phosphorylase